MLLTRFKERFVGIAGSISGITSVLGSWQVCHNICLGIIALLSIVGVTVVGFPLLFLTKVAVPFWILAFSFLLLTLFIHYKKRYMSHKLIILNSGLIVAGVPFQGLQSYLPFFWAIGGLLAAISIVLYAKDRAKKQKCESHGIVDGRHSSINSKKILFAIFLFLAAGVLAYSLIVFFDDGQDVGIADAKKENWNMPAILTGSTGDGDASMELTPLSFDNGKLIVALAANTHSVALDKFDLKQITTLEYADKVIKPLSAPQMSGHHVNGQLIFNVDGIMNEFIIRIDGIPKVEKRIFEWK